MCVDSRVIDKITVKYYFLFPRLDDMLDLMTGVTIFSKIDLKVGTTKLESGQGTNGLYKWLVMPFRLSMLLALS